MLRLKRLTLYVLHWGETSGALETHRPSANGALHRWQGTAIFPRDLITGVPTDFPGEMASAILVDWATDIAGDIKICQALPPGAKPAKVSGRIGSKTAAKPASGN